MSSANAQPLSASQGPDEWIRRAQGLEPQVRNFVNGRWIDARGERGLEKYSPRDGRLLYHFSAGGAHDVDEAVAHARAAFADGRWSQMPVQRRKEVLLKLAALLEANREELALLECLDVGKPITEALNFDVPAAAACIRFNAEAADKLYGKVYGVDRANLSFELRRPLGVIGGIVGWNFPLYLAAQKIGPVLATGNCLVLKPSELTCFSAARVAELALEAGVPAGVLNVVHGDADVGAALSRHQDIDLITFTGSTATGKQLVVAAGESNMKRLILECGGKAPNIVFADCLDLDPIADAIVTSAFWNQGQVCVASSRILIQAPIKDALLELIIRKASEVRPGDPLDPVTRFGALVSFAHRRKVQDFIASGIREGARLLYQTPLKAPHEAGFYLAPTIFDEVGPAQQIAQEEIFGPVVSVMSFADEKEAIGLANATRYGLSAILWTRDVGRAHRVAQSLDAGWIVVNATSRVAGGPGEGVLSIGGHKQSGIGTEGGLEGLEAYTRKSAVQLYV